MVPGRNTNLSSDLDNGRRLLLEMPSSNFANLKNEDVHAIYSYLKTIKTVRNIVPVPITPEDVI